MWVGLQTVNIYIRQIVCLKKIRLWLSISFQFISKMNLWFYGHCQGPTFISLIISFFDETVNFVFFFFLHSRKLSSGNEYFPFISRFIRCSVTCLPPIFRTRLASVIAFPWYDGTEMKIKIR